MKCVCHCFTFALLWPLSVWEERTAVVEDFRILSTLARFDFGCSTAQGLCYILHFTLSVGDRSGLEAEQSSVCSLLLRGQNLAWHLCCWNKWSEKTSGWWLMLFQNLYVPNILYQPLSCLSDVTHYHGPLKVTNIQCGFSLLPLMCRDFLGFLSSIEWYFGCRWWNSVQLRNVPKLLNNFLTVLHSVMNLSPPSLETASVILNDDTITHSNWNSF